MERRRYREGEKILREATRMTVKGQEDMKLTVGERERERARQERDKRSERRHFSYQHGINLLRACNSSPVLLDFGCPNSGAEILIAGLAYSKSWVYRVASTGTGARHLQTRWQR